MSKQIQKSFEKSKQLQKSLRKCLSKIKIPNKPILLRFQFPSCNHTKASSFSSDSEEEDEFHETVTEPEFEHKDNAVTLSDVDRFLFENFRSLFEEELTVKYGKKRESFLYEPARLIDIPPPPATASAARSRIFVRTNSSNSFVMNRPSYDSSESGVEEEENAAAVGGGGGAPLPDNFITLLTYSPSPYEDFRRSMGEMVKVRRENNGKVDWQFMEELLFCYLDLNNKKSYRYILRAFVDLAGVLRHDNPSGRISSHHRHPWKVGGGKRQLRRGDLII